MTNVEKPESIKDFQRCLYALAKACEEKFRGEINEVHIYPKDGRVSITFK